jgi:hypothetical protein
MMILSTFGGTAVLVVFLILLCILNIGAVLPPDDGRDEP